MCERLHGALSFDCHMYLLTWYGSNELSDLPSSLGPRFVRRDCFKRKPQIQINCLSLTCCHAF